METHNGSTERIIDISIGRYANGERRIYYDLGKGYKMKHGNLKLDEKNNGLAQILSETNNLLEQIVKENLNGSKKIKLRTSYTRFHNGDGVDKIPKSEMGRYLRELVRRFPDITFKQIKPYFFDSKNLNK